MNSLIISDDQSTVRRAAEETRRPGEVDIGLLLSILFRQWRLIALVTLLFVGAGFVYATFAPRVWQSTARVLLDPSDKQVVAVPGLSQPMQGVDAAWVDTQANVVTSASILSTVIDTLGLQSDAEFGGSRDETLRALVKAIKVERADQTYVLDISVRSRAADLSARIAQELAEAFVANQVEVKQAAVREASNLINRQLDDLRAKARTAQEKLEAYRRNHGILTANGRSVDEDTLRQLNDAYVAARVRTQDAKARRDKIAAARAGGSDAALTGIDSTVLSRLKIERALAARTVGELGQDLGPNHPRMVAARADLVRAEAQIEGELKTLSVSADAEYQVAAASEAAARKALDDAGAVVTDTSERTIELRELENEASLRADMYKTYVARTEEITLQANTQVSDARVIAPASIPLYPYAPRQTLVLALCAIAGLGLALTIAVYRGRRYLPEYRETSDEAFAAPTDTGSLPLPPREDLTSPPELETPPEEDASGTQAPAVPVEDETLPGSAAAKEPVAPSVLAEFTVATRAFERDLRGRSVGRMPRDILTSALTDGDGLPSQTSSEAFGALVRKITAAAGASRLVLVLGADHGPAAATIAFGLAHVPTRDGVLLIDASWDELPLHRAYVDEAIPGVIDVIAGRADATSIAVCEEGPDLTLIGVGGPDSADDIAADVGRVADFVDKLAEDFGRIILHCGHRHSPELFQALLGRVDAVLIVADAIIEQDDEAAEMVRDLASILPAFTGVVLVHERTDTLAVAERA
ncbi:exopolysaccharide transport family protein [Pleomorphomonas sp. JP5]|uniref:exopolysaccharide transport family protein n=1 Tax=Pleomorphomonas sp. JP5 TaxID=2942998 RepID=UPI002042FA7B|nr:exopolysaccharide transport family protein [Pleomorphomonas sp. JP5]MCM5558026.1 exopolysaccharide transport family protein [Pleomorphomonas sp. JP5]